MSIFISHAVADKEIVNALVDLLQTGLDIPQSDIFCSSLEGLSIPQGSNFVDFMRNELADAKFVISVLTPTYYERPFCLCELGATWIIQHDFFPLLVPPLQFSDLKAVLVGVQSGSITDKVTLNDLRDRLIKVGWSSGKTSRWEAKRDEFLNRISKISVAEASHVTLDTYKKLQETYDTAQEIISEKNDSIARLEKLVSELEQCKDKEEVKAVLALNKSNDQDECVELIESFRDEVEDLPNVVIEAIYQEFCGFDWSPRRFGNDDLWDQIDTAIERGFLDLHENSVATKTHPKIDRAVRKLYELSEYLDSEAAESSDFVSEFEEEFDYPLDLRNRDFWGDHLGL